MILAIALLSAAVYVTGFLMMGRRTYAAKRPFTEPLSCGRTGEPWHKHHVYCYQRPGTLISSAGEALAWAGFCAFIWPLVLLGLAAAAVGRALLASSRPQRAEAEAKTARLEHELGMEDRPPR